MWVLIFLIGTCLVPSWCLENTTVTTSPQCVLPPHPRDGIYEVLNVPDAKPGQSYSNVILTIKCRRGYGIMDQAEHRTTQQIYCIDGTWYPSPDSIQCVRFCKLDQDPSVTYKCEYPGQGVQKCESYVPPGTLVVPACNSPIYYSADVLIRMRCINGYWNYIARCKAECGRITSSGTQLIVDGRQAKHGEMPWHVGIYRITDVAFQQICGGSLVSESVAISAAHCFWTDAKKLLPAHGFGVAGGKLNRDWDSEEDGTAQKTFIKDIKIPRLYGGVATNFQQDIAVLTLTIPFKFTTYIQPVCLNFQRTFNNLQLQHGNLGKVAGWGLTEVNGGASPVLKVLEMPFISVDICLATIPAAFRAYLTGDKFCAGYVNGSAVCKGDSGGGLAFPDKELGIDRYYLRGVLSTAPNDAEKSCNDLTYSAFTKITDHEELIKDALAASEPVCPLFSFQCNDGSCVNPGSDCNGIQDCADGSDETIENCLVSNYTSTSQSYSECGVFEEDKFQIFPWTAYIQLIGNTSFHLFGTLISNTHVIFCHREGLLKYHSDKILVTFGAGFTYAVERHVIHVTEVEEHEEFQYVNGILKMDRRVEYIPQIRPACLWDGEIPEEMKISTLFDIVWIKFRNNDLERLELARYNTNPYLFYVLRNLNETFDIGTPYPTGDWQLGSNFRFLHFYYENKWRLCGILHMNIYRPYNNSVNIRFKKLTPNYLSLIGNELK